MTQEDKELLLKDLSSRLHYEVKGIITYDKSNTIFIVEGIDNNVLHLSNAEECHIEDFKPYLRPMSSMTKEEKEEIALIRDKDFQSVRKWIHDESIKETGNVCPVTCGENDYCNKKHLDYRELIEKGLALKAPKGMYDLKKNNYGNN